MITTLSSINTEGLAEAESIAMVQAMQSISIPTDLQPDSIITNYVQQGNGAPPLLLLHGFDSSLLEFRRLLPRLAQQTQVWAVDLLGFGFTERPETLSISPSAIREHLHQFWKTSIQQPVVLVGASMGGAAALDFALTYPELVQKLVLIDSAGCQNGPVLGRFLSDRLGNWVTEGFLKKPSVRQRISEKAYFDKSHASLDAQRCAALHLDCPGWAKALISFTRSGGYASFRKRFENVHCPTLVLWGECDRILGTKDAKQFERLIPDCQLQWIPNCGHVPHLEKADVTADAIFEFIGIQKRS
jgi:pimeloyl-ACP methyl ester carboxylesterase